MLCSASRDQGAFLSYTSSSLSLIEIDLNIYFLGPIGGQEPEYGQIHKIGGK